MTQRIRARVHASLLRTFIVTATPVNHQGAPRTLDAVVTLGEYVALTHTGAILQAAHAMARIKENAMSFTAKLKD